MKRNTIWRNLQKKTIHKPDKSNRENFPAYSRTIEEDVLSVLMTRSTANIFYAKAEENIKAMLDVIGNCEDPEFLAKATVYAREKGFTRTLPIAALVDISRGRSYLFRKIATRVCKNPKDWRTFIDIARSGVIRRGIGKALKKRDDQSLIRDVCLSCNEVSESSK